MRRHVIGLAFVLIVLIAPATMAQADKAEDEKLYGTWLVSSLEVLGKVQPAKSDEAKLTLVKGGKAIMSEKGKPDEVGTWKVYAGKTPKEIDLVGPQKDGKPEDAMKALYVLEGDTLKIVLSAAGPKGDRPTKIDSKETVIMILKRQKP